MTFIFSNEELKCQADSPTPCPSLRRLLLPGPRMQWVAGVAAGGQEMAKDGVGAGVGAALAEAAFRRYTYNPEPHS